VRKLDERLGLGDLIAHRLTDSRRRKNTQLQLDARATKRRSGTRASCIWKGDSLGLWNREKRRDEGLVRLLRHSTPKARPYDCIQRQSGERY
jgi:hypothetical protein